MKRIVLSALAFAMMAVPTVQSAQAAPAVAPQTHTVQSKATDVQYNRSHERRDNDRRYDNRRDNDRRWDNRRVVKKKVIVKQERHHASKWKRGQKYGNWRQYRAVNDYQRYGLHRPPHGQQWIRVGNEYLLVGIATGLIFGMLAAR
ncbi:MAG: RcnB family protein [Mesorhizobium sp.]